MQQRVVRFAQALAGRVERAALEAFPECRAGLDGEVVGRQVRHVERQKVVQRPPPLLDGQLRQTVDQVERQIGETGRLRVAHRSERLPRVVPAVHPSQVAVQQRLYSDAQPVGPGSAQRFQITGGQVVRIRFDGDLFDLRVERVADRAYQPLQFAGRADRRCPSSDVERSHRLPLQLVRPRNQFVRHGGQHGVFFGKRCAAVEVAVAAFAFAERYVNVDACHSFVLNIGRIAGKAYFCGKVLAGGRSRTHAKI